MPDGVFIVAVFGVGVVDDGAAPPVIAIAAACAMVCILSVSGT